LAALGAEESSLAARLLEAGMQSVLGMAWSVRVSWFLTRRLDGVDHADRRQAIERAFRKLYDGYARFLNQLQTSNEPEEGRLGQVLVLQEYANLGTALHLALDQQASILDLHVVLSSHLDHLQDHGRGRELGELVLEKLKRLPRNAFTAERGVELAAVVDDIARHELLMRQFDIAQTMYERALAIWDSLEGLDPRVASTARANTLHQLGLVAEEQGRFAQAESAYKKALEIFLAVDHRHSAAGTYHQLGTVALM
jgi:tetratricopeptide (TPR) repeat protein